MKKTFLTSIFLILTSLGFSQMSPQINFGTEEIDFGQVELTSDTLVANFYFKNSGMSELLISDVKTSCGCTVSSFPKTVIQPGEGDVITLKYKPTSLGDVYKSAVVYSNSSNFPEKVIKFKLSVVK